MTTDDLLLLRLDALALDITKVRAAVDVAQLRGQSLQKAVTALHPQRGKLNAVHSTLTNLVSVMDEDAKVRELVSEGSFGLDTSLKQAPGLIKEVIDKLAEAKDDLSQAVASTVTLGDDRTSRLQRSLDRRCEDLNQELQVLRAKVSDTPTSERRDQWVEYQSLLGDKARPVFMEYVDFLGGLTVRDTGLDDQVCEMTDALLSRFAVVTRPLPLPARQAALGSALDSVVLLGFPEWSIWGIPLVGHEVGLAYAKDRNDDSLVRLIRDFRPRVPRPAQQEPEARGATRSRPPAGPLETPDTDEYIQELIADAFATYTLGLSYACAALLLRLNPDHDQQPQPGRPRDIDRARVIMMMLQSEGPSSGGSFTDDVAILQRVWDAGVQAHAGPEEAAEALEESQGPPPPQDWLDDFTREAAQHFRALPIIRPFDDARWHDSETWLSALRGATPQPSWIPPENAVPDVLTAAWRLRLSAEKDPTELADTIKKSWETSRRGQ